MVLLIKSVAAFAVTDKQAIIEKYKVVGVISHSDKKKGTGGVAVIIDTQSQDKKKFVIKSRTPFPPLKHLLVQSIAKSHVVLLDPATKERIQLTYDSFAGYSEQKESAKEQITDRELEDDMPVAVPAEPSSENNRNHQLPNNRNRSQPEWQKRYYDDDGDDSLLPPELRDIPVPEEFRDDFDLPESIKDIPERGGYQGQIEGFGRNYFPGEEPENFGR